MKESHSINKSKRAEDNAKDLLAEEDQEEFQLFKPPPPGSYGYGEYMFAIAQGVCILLFGLCAEYGEGVHPSDVLSTEADSRDIVQGLYPFFQDVHVMIFVGFGFLMTFIKTSSWSAMCFNWIISCWALQWAILSNGFWHQVVQGEPLHRVNVTMEKLIIGDFGAGAAMITFGALLGKCNLQQLFFLVWWEMLFWGLNEAICAGPIKATDMGGSMLVHTFGAYYGLAASYFFQPSRAAKSNNIKTSYQSELVAVVGSIFLWMYWPSFNGALASGVTQQRVVVNTVLAISGSCIAGACVARILFGKLEMEIMLNATLAGGVCIGSASDIIVTPWAAIFCGFLGGALSSIGFQKIGPFLASTLNLQDTCGVHSLHGMPGVFGAIISAIAIAGSTNKGFPADYFPHMADGGSAADQAAA